MICEDPRNMYDHPPIFIFFSKTEKSLAMIIYCVIRERSNYLVYRDEYDAASGDPYRKVPGYDGLY